jgi:hypothetical protein
VLFASLTARLTATAASLSGQQAPSRLRATAEVLCPTMSRTVCGGTTGPRKQRHVGIGRPIPAARGVRQRHRALGTPKDLQRSPIQVSIRPVHGRRNGSRGGSQLRRPVRCTSRSEQPQGQPWAQAHQIGSFRWAT